MQLSSNTRHLLAQHLHWINNGYDEIKLNEVFKVINEENLFSATRLNQIERKIGTQNNTAFELEELEKLIYFYPCLINFDGKLAFFKYCLNLKELDLGCLDLEDISDLAFLKNLTKIDLSSTKINSIDALATLKYIEEINLEYCKTVSLLPLLQHKKLKKVVLDDVENEEDILEIVSNQETCYAEYIIKNSSNLQGLSFPSYWVSIHFKMEILNIELSALVTDKYGKFCKIPTEMLEDKGFMVAYNELLNTELDKRVNAVLKSNYDILESNKYYTNEEIDFGVKMKIKKRTNYIEFE